MRVNEIAANKMATRGAVIKADAKTMNEVDYPHAEMRDSRQLRRRGN